MKKIVYGIASLTLAASILGACSNGEATSTNKNEDTKQEASVQANVKELTLTSDSDKQESKMVHSIAQSAESKDDKGRDKLYAQSDKSEKASTMLDRAVRYTIKGDSPVSNYEAFLYTYTGKNHYKYTEDTKAESEKVLKELNVLVEQYKKDTGSTDVSEMTALVKTDSVKAVDKGNHKYEVTGTVQLLGGKETKEYTIVSDAVFNNVIGYMQAKNFKLK